MNFLITFIVASVLVDVFDGCEGCEVYNKCRFQFKLCREVLILKLKNILPEADVDPDSDFPSLVAAMKIVCSSATVVKIIQDLVDLKALTRFRFTTTICSRVLVTISFHFRSNKPHQIHQNTSSAHPSCLATSSPSVLPSTTPHLPRLFSVIFMF